MGEIFSDFSCFVWGYKLSMKIYYTELGNLLVLLVIV